MEGTAWQDGIISDLYNLLEENPKSIYIHERLLEVWKELGEEELAAEAASTLALLDPGNKVVKVFLDKREPSKTEQKSHTNTDSHRHEQRPASPPPVIDSWAKAEKFFSEEYSSLRLEATLLHEEITFSSSMIPTPSDQEVISNLQAIGDGHVSAVIPMAQPLSVREVARTIVQAPSSMSQTLIIEDFEFIIRWASFQHPPLSTDSIRDRLVKRKVLLEAALPETMRESSTAAFQFIERKHLEKSYVNTETMFGDDIADVPKENFFVSEDNYAWDMDELAQAITSNDCVMRNPLSKQMFTESDIKRILAHPLGRRLKLGIDQQAQYRKGIRQTTIDWCAKLGNIMLQDQSIDTLPSKQALEEFRAYVATLPETEQQTIKLLKISAVDSTSRQPFDYTIGESVQDAIANTTCLHKVGDFLTQAAVYLKGQ